MTRQVRLRRKVVCAAVAGILAVASPVAATSPASAADNTPANAVIVWDRNAQTAIWEVAGQQPQVQARSFAMVHGAVYDAVNAIAGRPYQPYLIAPPTNGRESVDAAVGTAAFRVLSSLFPDQQARLQTQYDEWLATVRNGIAKQRGISVGSRTAAAMISARQHDGAFGDPLWPVGTEPGQWRPTPPTNANDGAWVGNLKPFLIPSASMFRSSGPPALTSDQYARDFTEVKAIGAVNSTIRTVDQRQAAIWWHDRHLGEWEIKRQLATTQRLNTLQTARMFALVDLAEADATTACYNEKGAWTSWRPVTAIQLADTDGNPSTEADPHWMPLLVTPPHPDFTSGHTCFTAASMSALRHFFGRDDIPFSAFSEASGTTRYFGSFSQATAEVIEARIWGGIHTRTADVEGAKIGAQVTAYAIKNYFRPRR
ncbi:phosphatase PAP2 family protein [Micromonospora sp. 4G57]|uniref:Phosphatase PAP2 family protein n=1 Tax=Micromonospora sicca TaxID=2202420 RepID=A0ABU5J5V0_9ACTN|nr:MULTISPECIES: phosphatase PAP2 family protein [unclassified Micromonospora]MDZ5444912.1 phosphatase PAP2 family protein [Micromonospora sp. 4G57]MDZ5487928.1 phosphatase PAP2 family protein [Micromonospora sp. 4G53]